VSIYVNKNNGFEQTETISRECPHCGAHAQLLPLATPSYEALVEAKPRHIGIVYRCAACNEPRFVRAAVRAFEPERVELSANLLEVERARERFQYSYLPGNIERLLREALECYTAGCHNAFASMCRRTMQEALASVDANALRRWQDQVREVLRIGELDARAADRIAAVLFADDPAPPEIDPDEAAVLIEVIKDLLYQSYVRTSKLQAAIKMRRYFARETAQKVIPIDGRSRRDSDGRDSARRR
jgi:hypothetical protein